MLEKEQEHLLIRLVEAERSIPRNEREYFYVGHTIGGPGVELIHSGIPNDAPRIFEGDLRTLASRGLISIVSHSRDGIESFHIKNEGLRAYEMIMKKRGQPLERVQKSIREYIDSDKFRSLYPTAYEKWSQAEKLLWEDDSEKVLTTIGHLIRETMQEFADTVVKRYNPQGDQTDKSKTVARIRSTLNSITLNWKTSEKEFLDALLAYWGTISDLVQRQEHGALKEKESLLWYDARRIVFQTAVVIYEIDNTLSRTNRN